MLEFIEELKEARMFRSRETLKGKSADELAQALFLMIMMVEILRTEDSKWLKDYINTTLSDQEFSSLRSNSTDLHNIISVLSNQDKFSDKIETNSKISPPLLQIKRYFRDIINDRKLPGVDRSFFKGLEGFLKIQISEYKDVRRAVGDWKLASPTEKRTTRFQIKNLIRPTNQQNDLLLRFLTKLHS